MKTLQAVLAVLVTVGTLASCVSLQRGANVEQELRSIMLQRAAWVQSRDVDSLFAQMTPDFTVSLRNGQVMTLQDLRARWAVYYDRILIRHIHFINDVKAVEQRGDMALVTVEQKDKRLQNGPDGKPREVEADVIHVETWVRTPRGWMLRLTEEGKQTKFVIDGKPQPLN
jgi:ketosteroid isomerase-like protein